MLFRYAGVIAINPNTDQTEIVKSATGTVHLNENWDTPIEVHDVNGFAMTTLNTTVEGLFPDFYVEDQPVVGFKTSSGHRFYLRSSTPVPGAEGPAPEAIESVDGALLFRYPGGLIVQGPIMPQPDTPTDQSIAEMVANPETETGGALNQRFASQFTANETTTAADINEWLSTGSAFGVKRLHGKATIGAPGIIVPGNTTLDATGATITEAPNTHGNLLNNAAVEPLRVGSADAVVTAGTGTITVTSTSAGFLPGDVGNQIAVNHLTAGTGMNVYGTITAVNGTSATVSGVARATESGGAVSIYGRDKSITLIGGTWNRGANSGSGSGLHTLRLRRVDSLTVRDMAITSQAGKYALSLGDVTDYSVRTVQFDSASDGLHVQGPAYRGRVDDLRGFTHDDLLGITAADYQQYNDVFGDIDGITVTGLHQNGGLAALKIIGGIGCKVRGVTTTGIYGTSLIRPVAIGSDIAGPSDLDGIVVRDVFCMPPASTEPLVRLWAAVAGEPVKIGSLILENFKYHGQAGQLIRIDGAETVTVDHLVARNFRATGGSLTGLMMVQGNARLGNVEVDGLRVESAGATNATYCMFSFAGAVIDRFTVRNSAAIVTATGGKFIGGLGNLKTLNLHGITTTQQDVVRTDQTTPMTVNMSDVKASHATGGRLVRFQGPVKLNLSGDIVADFQAEPFQMGGASASLDVTGAFAPMNGRATAVRDLTQTITARDIRFQVRADWLAKVTGSMAYNAVAQASGALPVGPVYFNGTAWVHMVTGGTWTPA